MHSRSRVMCEFDVTTSKCARCGRVAKALPCRAVCDPPGLGDLVGSALARLGITESLFPNGCGCAQRKRWLNRMGRVIGI